MTTNLAPDTHPAIELTDNEKTLLAIARRVAEDSPDRSRKVGAVIIDPATDHIVSVGCNTLPEGVEHSDEFLTRPAKYDWTEHAERNAIFEVAKSKDKSTEGCAIVLPWFPCVPCSRAIVQAGITRVVSPYPDISDQTWGSDFVTALRILEKGGVQFDHFIDDRPPPAARADDDPAESTATEDRAPVQAWVEHWNTHRELFREGDPAPSPSRRRPGAR